MHMPYPHPTPTTPCSMFPIGIIGVDERMMTIVTVVVDINVVSTWHVIVVALVVQLRPS